MSDLTEIYTWTEVDEEGGEGTICVMMPGMRMGPITLLTRRRAVAEGPMRTAAEFHHQATGHRVRLVRWTRRENIEEFCEDFSE